MTALEAIILGIVEGVTEFLPISSTFHLLMTNWLLGIPQTEFVKVFAVFIQTGGILAVLSLYGKSLYKDKPLLTCLALSFVPTAVVGFLLHDVIKGVLFESQLFQIVVFMVVGLIFIAYEYWLAKKSGLLQLDLTAMTYQQAVLIGAAQALAVIPGVSRAGIVILAMMLLKFRREEAARYSFILAVPTIMAAGLYDVIKTDPTAFYGENVSLLAVGFVTAFVVALLVLRWFIRYLQTHTLAWFGWYRVVVGAVLLLLLWRM